MTETPRDDIEVKIALHLSQYLDSVTELLNYMQGKVEFNETLLKKLVELFNSSHESNDLLTEYFPETEEIQTATEQGLDDIVKRISIIRMYTEAMKKISEGTDKVLFLFGKEMQLDENFFRNPNFKRFQETGEDPHIEEIVDTLFEGAKLMIELTDKITSAD